MTGLAAPGAEPQTEALKYVTATSALCVLASRTELPLVRERIIQQRRLVSRDDRCRVELGQAASLDNPQPLVVQKVSR
jgi:hypothetical protein